MELIGQLRVVRTPAHSLPEIANFNESMDLLVRNHQGRRIHHAIRRHVRRLQDTAALPEGERAVLD